MDSELHPSEQQNVNQNDTSQSKVYVLPYTAIIIPELILIHGSKI